MKIAVGLSGGVDSSVAAKLLIDQGHEVSGVTLRLLNGGDNSAAWQELINGASQAAAALNIPHRIYDFRLEFQEKIINYFVESYRRGETPNPCYICNKRIKFGLFLERALQEGFDAVATGHYAKIIRDGAGRFGLAQGADKQKDQSYFLALLNQRQLRHSIFPLAALSKDEVRHIAAGIGLVNARKADSQDICFVPDGDYAAVVESVAPEAFSAGDFIDMDGKKIGTHRGLHHYTIGQRRGLGLPLGYPVYVAEKSAQNNSIRVGTEDDLSAVSCTVRDINWIAERPSRILYAAVKTRYRQQLKKAGIEPLGNDEARIVFELPERAVACGQAAVFYDADRVLGGGIISSVERTGRR